MAHRNPAEAWDTCCRQELMFLNKEQSGSNVCGGLGIRLVNPIAIDELQALMGHSPSFAVGVIVQLSLQPQLSLQVSSQHPALPECIFNVFLLYKFCVLTGRGGDL